MNQNPERLFNDQISNYLYTECLKATVIGDRHLTKNEEDSLSNCYVRFLESLKIVNQTQREEAKKQLKL